MLIENNSNLIDEFEANQTIESLSKILDAGLELKKLESNKWINVITNLSLPIRFVRLYDKVGKDMVLTGIGIY